MISAAEDLYGRSAALIFAAKNRAGIHIGQKMPIIDD